MVSPFFVSVVNALPAAILRVSLPAGTAVGPDPDPWLSEGWLLSLNGTTQTFVVNINSTSSSQRSYDTHLVMALNDAGYNNLVSLQVNAIAVPKSAFQYGTPSPYNLWVWPSGDIYPAWFNDTLVNVGTIQREGFVQATVSVTFSNITGVRMHFDSWGKRVRGPPTSDGDITHNSPSTDSTVVFQPGTPQPQPPIASFSFTPSFPNVGEIVTFNASSSYDPDGNIVSYTWNFGDSTPVVVENDPITTHSYAALGNFEVTLTVTDNDGLNGTDVDIVPVSLPPVASFVFSPPDPLEHETVTFDASSSTPDGGTIISYTWNFGDGNITTVSDPVITHTYAAYGGYTVTLNVTDSTGKWDTESKSITVERLPLADFTWSPVYPEVYEVTTFDASLSTPDGGVFVSYEWDFGDGIPKVIETDPITTHYYTVAGNYTVTLNVTDSEDRWDTESKIITIYPSPSPEAILHLSLPDGTYVYSNPDPWLDECWLLNITGLSGTFTLNITDVSGSITSYDTHLIIALNNEAYNNLLSLSVNGTNVSKTAFKNGTPTPYNLWVWPSGDIYPSWFNDTLINVGTIPPTGSVILNISVTFSNASGARMHFDAYGSKDPVPPSPDIPGKITRNPVSGDSTVQFFPPPAVQYQITFDQTGVGDDFNGTIVVIDGTSYNRTRLPVSFLWDEGSTHNFSFQSPLVVTPNAKRYLWNSTSGLSSLQSSSITVSTSGNIIGNYKTQYYLTVATNPLGVTTPSGEGWHYDGTYAAISTDEFVPIVPGASQYRFDSWTTPDVAEITNPTSPSTTVLMDKAKTVTANYVTQYLLSVKTIGLPSAYPTKVFLDGLEVGTASDAFHYTKWFDSGTPTGTIGVDDIVSGASDTRYVFVEWTEDSSSNNPRASETMDSPKTFTALYKTQYFLTVNTDPAGLSPAPTPASDWYDNSTNVVLTAPSESYLGSDEYEFTYWDVDGRKVTGNPITVHMNRPHTATAHYVTPKPRPVGGFWEPVNVTAPTTDYTLMIMALLTIGTGLIGTLIPLKKRSKKK